MEQRKDLALPGGQGNASPKQEEGGGRQCPQRKKTGLLKKLAGPCSLGREARQSDMRDLPADPVNVRLTGEPRNASAGSPVLPHVTKPGRSTRVAKE